MRFKNSQGKFRLGPILGIVGLVVLLVPLILAQTAPTQFAIQHDTTNDPLCSATLPNDCVKVGRLFRLDSQGAPVFVQDVPASAFLPVAGQTNIFEADIPIPIVGTSRYGKTKWFVQMIAVDPVGVEVASDNSSTTETTNKRPRVPVVFTK